MNTRYSEEEMKRLPEDVIVETLDLGKWEREDAIIPLRNLYMVMVATNYGDEICLGATAGDRVLDKSVEFGTKTSELLSYLYSEQHWTHARDIKINLDFKGMTKSQLIAKYKQQGGDLQEAVESSFSCYNPINGHECWNCKPCFRKFVSFNVNGYKFDDEANKTVCEYIRTEVLPKIESNTYGRGEQEERDIMEVYNALSNNSN